jgi:hypothetical protein
VSPTGHYCLGHSAGFVVPDLQPCRTSVEFCINKKLEALKPAFIGNPDGHFLIPPF